MQIQIGRMEIAIAHLAVLCLNNTSAPIIAACWRERAERGRRKGDLKAELSPKLVEQYSAAVSMDEDGCGLE